MKYRKKGGYFGGVYLRQQLFEHVGFPIKKDVSRYPYFQKNVTVHCSDII